MNMNYMKYERKINNYSLTILISFHYISRIIHLCTFYVTISRSLSMQHLRHCKLIPIYATFTACKA